MKKRTSGLDLVEDFEDFATKEENYEAIKEITEDNRDQRFAIRVVTSSFCLNAKRRN